MELRKHLLFEGFSDAEYEETLAKLKRKKIKPGVFIAQPGSRLKEMYILLEGKVEVYSLDLQGNKKVVTILGAQELLGESIVLGKKNISPFFVSVISSVHAVVIPFETIQSEQLPRRFLYNLLQLLATKNQFLVHKISCLDKGTIEERVFEVLQYYSLEQQSLSITLPFNKTQLAQYLGVHRSALSRDMSKMEKNGIFKNSKNQYYLNSKYFENR